MNILKQLSQLERIDQLIRLKATGSPKKLARRLNLSERHTYRLINELTNAGFPISYNRHRESYEYTEPISWQMYINIDSEEKLSFKGGN